VTTEIWNQCFGNAAAERVERLKQSLYTPNLSSKLRKVC